MERFFWCFIRDGVYNLNWIENTDELISTETVEDESDSN